MLPLLLLTTAWAGDGAIVGYAFVELTGSPLGQVEVTAEAPDAPPVRAITNPDGRFELTLPEGLWTVRFAPQDLKGGAIDEVRVAEAQVTEMLVTFFPDALPRADVQAPVGDVREELAPDTVLAPVTGTITGPDGEPVSEARIFVRGFAVDASSDTDGTFALELPPGEHELTVLRTGYATTTVPVAIGPGESKVAVDVVMDEASSSLDDMVVLAPYVEGSVASLLDERRESTTVQDVLGAEQMSRAGDSDAASALSRVTGITIVGGKYVYVRGLGDRYSSSLMNGAMLPSPEPERRVVPLDLFPSSILESVVVQKSYSPDMPGEFGGGVVQLRTRRAPTSLVANVSVSGAYRKGTTFQQGLDDPGGPTDWLGFDGGYRDLPQSIVDASANSPLEETDIFSPERGYTAEELEAFGEALDPTRWEPTTRTLPIDRGLSMSLGHGIEREDWNFGALGALTWNNDWQRLEFDRTYYLVGAGSKLEPQHQYHFNQATNEVTLGGFFTTGLEVKDQSIRYTGMVNRSTDSTARIYEGYNRDVGDDIRITRLRFVERQLAYHQLLGHHGLFDLGEADWRFVRADAARSEPDRRETRYDYEKATDNWLLSDRPEGNGIFDSDLADRSTELGADLTAFLRLREDEVPGQVKIGAVRVDRERAVDTRRYKYFHKGPNSRDPDILALPADQVFVPENIGSDGFQFEEFTRQTDNYTASQQIRAFYAMAEVPVLRWLRLMGGVRNETSSQTVSTFELFNPDAVPVDANLSTEDWLPAASLTVTPLEPLQIRLGYGKTVSRPDFRELSPATFNDVTGGRLTFGNPDLKRATIDHVDLRFDWFLGPGELLSLSLFRKTFTDPIETIVVVSAQQSVTWANASSATNDGVEVEFRKDLPLNLYTAGNVALVRSQIDLGGAGGIQTNAERALQGQSPYVVNVQAGWDHPDRGDRITLLYNVAGRRIVEVGAQGAPDTYELPVSRLDAVARKDIGRGFNATVKGSNLLNPAARTLQGTQEVDAIRSGWKVGLSVGWGVE